MHRCWSLMENPASPLCWAPRSVASEYGVEMYESLSRLARLYMCHKCTVLGSPFFDYQARLQLTWAKDSFSVPKIHTTMIGCVPNAYVISLGFAIITFAVYDPLLLSSGMYKDTRSPWLCSRLLTHICGPLGRRMAFP